MKVIERQMRRGCGLLQFHWSTFAPSRFHDQITEWVGGYFDYEKGNAANHWYPAIQTWTGPVTLPAPTHPICRGVKPFAVQEEFYYRIRFRPDDPRVTPILDTRPPNEAQDFPVAWAVQRKDGGRGFGLTGGHFYKNWWLPDYRRLILNAIVWTAGRVRLYVDGKQAADQTVVFNNGAGQEGDLAFGSLVSRDLGCDGLIDDVRLSKSALDIKGVPRGVAGFEEGELLLPAFTKGGRHYLARLLVGNHLGFLRVPLLLAGVGATLFFSDAHRDIR